MPFPDVRNPELAYATKDNIQYPGTAAQATAAEAVADARADDGLPTGVTYDVGAGAITPET
jgi:hypothetical protein